MCSPDSAGDNRQCGREMVDTSEKSRTNFREESVLYLYLAIFAFPAISLGRRGTGRSQGAPTDDLGICARVQKEEPQGWFFTFSVGSVSKCALLQSNWTNLFGYLGMKAK